MTHVQVLKVLDYVSTQSVDCLLLDIRQYPDSVLTFLDDLPQPKPVVFIADQDQPLGSLLQTTLAGREIMTVPEIGSSLFWYRVSRAIQSHAEPLGIAHKHQPIRGLLQEIVDYTSDWIFIKDLDHRFLLASESFAQSAGLPVKELIGKNDLDIGSSPDHVLGNSAKGLRGFWPQDDAVTDSGQISIEENPHWDLYSNTERYRRTIRVPLKNAFAEVYGLLVCSQDITEQRENEIMLKERTEVLAKVIEQKKHAEQSQRIAEEAVAAKTRFLAATSHDLRQPLHAMGLFLDILDNRLAGTEEQSLLKQIKQSCSSLNSLFNGCLDISRLDAGVVESLCESIRLSAFLDSLNEEFSQQAYEKGLKYSCQVDESVAYTDPMLLGRIVRNLFNNAIENTERGELSIRCAVFNEGIRLSVSDTGTGIPDSQKEAIFREFHQIDSRNAKQGRGLGLGLAIVKRLCELLEIDIRIESEPGKGSCFKLTIPRGVEENIPAVRQDVNNYTLKGTRVLIIDDDPHIQLAMQVLLESYGCNAFCSMDLASTLNVLESESRSMDIIVADYHLANGETGCHVIQQVRESQGYRIPAILVTGDTAPDSASQAALTSLTLLYKPVSADILLDKISNELVEQIS